LEDVMTGASCSVVSMPTKVIELVVFVCYFFVFDRAPKSLKGTCVMRPHFIQVLFQGI